MASTRANQLVTFELLAVRDTLKLQLLGEKMDANLTPIPAASVTEPQPEPVVVSVRRPPFCARPHV